MEIKINKEIKDYKESMFFGLSMRQFVCSALAVGAAIGTYFGLRDIAGKEMVSWLCIIIAAPFAAAGFFKYNGMTFEQFALADIRSEILATGKRVYKSENFLYKIYEEVLADDKKNRKKRGKSKENDS